MDDAHAWALGQAAALRRLGARRPEGVDAEGLAAAMEGVAAAAVGRVRGALFRLMQGAVLLALAENDDIRAGDWRAGMVADRLAAADAFAPSMRGVVAPELGRLWLAAREAAAARIGSYPEAVGEVPPFGLGDLLHGAPLEALVRRVRAAAG